jgi:type VI secretion system protein VasD
VFWIFLFLKEGGAKHMRQTRFIQWAGFSLLILFGLNISSCASKPVKLAPTKIKLDISAAGDLNPDIKGQPSSLYFIVYELRSDGVFNNATFFGIYDDENAKFKKDLINKEEKHIDPGQTLIFEKKLPAESKFIGILAAYRDINNAEWRAVTQITQNKTNELKVDFTRLGIKTTKIKSLKSPK